MGIADLVCGCCGLLSYFSTPCNFDRDGYFLVGVYTTSHSPDIHLTVLSVAAKHLQEITPVAQI